MERFATDSDTSVIMRLEAENRALDLKIREFKKQSNRLTSDSRRVVVADQWEIFKRKDS